MHKGFVDTKLHNMTTITLEEVKVPMCSKELKKSVMDYYERC